MTPFEAAELAFDKAVQSERVAGAQRLEAILEGNGEYTSDVAFEVWQAEMNELGFAEYASDTFGTDCAPPAHWQHQEAQVTSVEVII